MMSLVGSLSWVFWRVVALEIVLPAVITSSPDECTHYYLTQPPESFTCNPFHQLNRRIRLECSAYCSDQGEYDIVWFRLLGDTDDRNQTQQPQLLSSNIRRVSINTRGQRNNFSESELTVTNLQYEDVGVYWCQIVIPPTNTTPTKYFQPSIPTSLLPEESYANLPPCPIRVWLSQPTSQCAIESDKPALPPSKPAEDTIINPSVVSHSVHLCSTQLVTDMEAGPDIPYWSYSLIAVGVIALCVIGPLGALLILLYKRKGISKNCVKASTRKTTSSDQTSMDTPNSFVSPYLEVTGNAGSTKIHSSVHSLHVTLHHHHDESDTANEKAMPSTPKFSTKVKKTTKPPPPPPPPPYKANTKKKNSTKPPPPPPPPLKTRGENTVELHPKKQVYHSLNAATKNVPSVYTVPIHSTTQPIQVQQAQCIDESGAYSNDPRYEPLTPVTTDYLSLYSSADREQGVLPEENNDYAKLDD